MFHARSWSRRTSIVALMSAAGAVILAPRAEAEDAPPCDALEVEYSLAGQLTLSDTPMGQGDGTYPVGPGRAIVRFSMRNGEVAGPAKLVAYEMNERFRIDNTTVFWTTHVTTSSKTTVGADTCGVVANGTLANRTLTFTSPLRGSRTDGTVTCEGSLCGKMGAPRPGSSPLQVPPHDVSFQPWVFGADLKTFTMAKTWSAHTESPKQTAHISLSGRELRRECVSFSSRPGC